MIRITRLLYAAALMGLLSASAAHAMEYSLTCRFEYQQWWGTTDLASPHPSSGPMKEPEILTLVFNLEKRTGTYTRGNGVVGRVVVSEGAIAAVGEKRINFSEVASDRPAFFLTVFTHARLRDGRYPAVVSYHLWMLGEQPPDFLPTQSIGGCR
jgi:hypothetical protein